MNSVKDGTKNGKTLNRFKQICSAADAINNFGSIFDFLPGFWSAEGLVAKKGYPSKEYAFRFSCELQLTSANVCPPPTPVSCKCAPLRCCFSDESPPLGHQIARKSMQHLTVPGSDVACANFVFPWPQLQIDKQQSGAHLLCHLASLLAAFVSQSIYFRMKSTK